MDNLLLFGGTFDPVHAGHINTARAIQQFFKFDQFAFLPCKIPVVDKHVLTTSSQHRLTMLNLALAEQAKHYHFYVDRHEMNRNSPSYMVTTLNEFRKEFGGDRSITLLLGLDAFCQLSQWYQWQQLIKLANLLIINRKGYDEKQIPEDVKELLLAHETANPKALLTTPHGLIARFNAGDYAISSTTVRDKLKAKKLPRNFLSKSVCNYIIENKLYCLE